MASGFPLGVLEELEEVHSLEPTPILLVLNLSPTMLRKPKGEHLLFELLLDVRGVFAQFSGKQLHSSALISTSFELVKHLLQVLKVVSRLITLNHLKQSLGLVLDLPFFVPRECILLQVLT